MSIFIRVVISKIINTIFNIVNNFPLFIFDSNIIIFKKCPCFFCLRKHFYRFRENIPIARFQGVQDIFKTIQTFISDPNGSARYMAPLFQIINDIPYYRFFAFVPRIHFHANRDLVCIKKQTHANDGLFFVFFRWSLKSEIIFLVNFKIEVCAVEVAVGSIKRVF